MTCDLAVLLWPARAGVDSVVGLTDALVSLLGSGGDLGEEAIDLTRLPDDHVEGLWLPAKTTMPPDYALLNWLLDAW